MAGERSRYINVNVEIETAFATENGGHSWLALPVRQDSIQADFRQEPLDDDTVRQDPGANQPIAGSKAGSTYNMQTFMGGLGTAAGDDVTPTRTAMGTVMLGMMGTETLLDGDTVAAGAPTTTGFGLVNQAATTLAGVVMFGVTTANYGVQWRPGTLTAGTVALLIELPEAPAAGAVVYGSANYQLDDDITEANSFQAQLLTTKAEQKFLGLGMFADSVELDMSARQLCTATINTQMVDWTDGESDSLADYTVGNKNPWMDSHAFMPAFGDTTATEVAVKGSATITLTRGLQLRDDPNASQGASMFDTPGDSFAMAKFAVPTIDDYRDAFGLDNASYYHIFFATGRTPGKVEGCYIRKAHQTTFPQETEQNGIKTTSLELAMTSGVTSPGVVYFQG